MTETDSDRLHVNFTKSKVNSKSFDKFLFWIRENLFNHRAGISFEYWIENTFTFRSSYGEISDMDKNIRKFPKTNAPSQQYFQGFIDMFDKNLPRFLS